LSSTAPSCQALASSVTDERALRFVSFLVRRIQKQCQVKENPEQPIFNPEVIGPRIAAFLSRGEPIPVPKDILVKALEELKVAGDFRYTFLLAFFSIEQVISDLLRSAKNSRAKCCSSLAAGENQGGRKVEEHGPRANTREVPSQELALLESPKLPVGKIRDGSE
jgi:hypothetical protein